MAAVTYPGYPGYYPSAPIVTSVTRLGGVYPVWIFRGPIVSTLQTLSVMLLILQLCAYWLQSGGFVPLHGCTGGPYCDFCNPSAGWSLPSMELPRHSRQSFTPLLFVGVVSSFIVFSRPFCLRPRWLLRCVSSVPAFLWNSCSLSTHSCQRS